MMNTNKTIAKFILSAILAIIFSIGAFAATLNCELMSDNVMTIDQFGFGNVELACTSTGGSSSNIQVNVNSNPSQGLSFVNTDSAKSTLSSEESDTVAWTVEGQTSGDYDITFTASTSDGNQVITDTVDLTVASPPQLNVEYVLPPSVLPVAVTTTLNVKITNVGGQTATNVYLQLNDESRIQYPTEIPAGESRTYSWTINTNGTYTTKVYVGDVLHSSVSAYIYPNADGVTGLTGWNLLAPTRQLANSSVASVVSLVSGKYNALYSWDSNVQNWKWYIPGLSKFSTFTTMSDTTAFWIKYNQANVSLNFTGSSFVSSMNVTLKPGWNLVGYPLQNSKVFNTALSSGVTDCIDDGNVWRYNSSSSYEIINLASHSLENGKGYWIKIKNEINCTTVNMVINN